MYDMNILYKLKVCSFRILTNILCNRKTNQLNAQNYFLSLQLVEDGIV